MFKVNRSWITVLCIIITVVLSVGCNQRRNTEQAPQKPEQAVEKVSPISEDLMGGISIRSIPNMAEKVWSDLEKEEANKSTETSTVSLTGESFAKTRGINAKPAVNTFGYAMNSANSKTPIMVYFYRDKMLLEKVLLQPNQLYSSNPYKGPGEYSLKIACIDQSKSYRAKGAVTSRELTWTNQMRKELSTKPNQTMVNEIMRLARVGKVPKSPFGVHSNPQTIIKNWGKPARAGQEVETQKYMFYDKKGFGFTYSNSTVSSVISHHPSLTNLTVPEIKKALGKPIREDVGSQFSSLTYKAGKYMLEFGYSSKSGHVISVEVFIP